MESPDNRLKSSRTEAAEVGAEETEEEALPAAGGADGAEIREQPSRESSAVSGSETGCRETEFSHGRSMQWTETHNSIATTYSDSKSCKIITKTFRPSASGFENTLTHLFQTLPQSH